MRGLRRRLPVLAVIALPALHVSCTEDNPTRPPIEVVTPPPAQGARGVIATVSFGEYQPGVWVTIPIAISQHGFADITVDWTLPDTWMYVYFGQTACNSNLLYHAECPYLLASEAQKPKPRVLITGPLDPGTYYIYLYNVPPSRLTPGIGSNNTEAVSIQVGLTVNASSGRSDQVIRLGRPTFVPPPGL